MTLFESTATALSALVKSRAVSAVQVAQAHIERIERLDPTLNCFTDTVFARARAAAAAVDAAIAAGDDPGPLAGVPIAVKNLYDVAGLTTRAE
jgi:Asp-tRNA(Asn)/Glu-tRNA(Gln) amidotransferase A subunit family amidase